MTSKDLQQLDFIGQPAKADVLDVSIGMIRKRPTFLRAFNLAVEASGKEDKDIYSRIGIDASHWTRIRNGAASIPGDERFLQLWKVLGNNIPLIWWAESEGYDWSTIRKHQDDKDKRIEALESQIREKDAEIAAYHKVFREARR